MIAAPRLRGPYWGREGKPYRPHPDLVSAANTALLLEVPLLLTGEPGCGKTQFAWAAARALHGGQPLQCYVRSDSRARDLLYHYDAVRRFADAQSERKERAAWPHPYVELRPLGKALMSEQQQVVLIDEIDKAPRDLPNDLLWELDQGHFEIAEIGDEEPPFSSVFRRTMTPPAGARRPFIVITSNVERQLPDAFLRRCVFYHIPFPDWPGRNGRTGKDGTRDDTLLYILRDHFEQSPSQLDEQGKEAFFHSVLTIFMRLRSDFKLTKKPATAELLDWARALLHDDSEDGSEGVPGRVTRLAQAGKVPFRELPALGCLLKLREDLDRVGAGA